MIWATSRVTGPSTAIGLLVTGRVGAEVSVEQAYDDARATGLSILASLKQELGDLDRVTGWIKALGFVNCAEGFNVTPAAINGSSDLILALWGDAGRRARSAIGAGQLPFGMPVEVRRSSRLTAATTPWTRRGKRPGATVGVLRFTQKRKRGLGPPKRSLRTRGERL